MSKVKIILNGNNSCFGISPNILKEYNQKTNSNLKFYDCRFVSEFIERIENGDCINNVGGKLYIVYISEDAIKYNAWKIDEYDGVENIIINYEKIKVCKIQEFLNILKKILYDDSNNLTDEMRLEYIRMLAPREALENLDFQMLFKNAELLPMFSTAFCMLKKVFIKYKLYKLYFIL